METFADLGIPFPLYEAPIRTCPDYEGKKICCIAKEERTHCFHLGIGSWVKMPCIECKTDLYLNPIADQYRMKECPHCKAPTPPPIAEKDNAYVSYEELRSGQAGYTKDSVYGLISWEQLESGWTLGVPDENFPTLETRKGEDDWTQVKLPQEVIFELTTTPNFITWQGGMWLFRETQPMIYIGEWGRKDFESKAPSGVSPEQFFRSVVSDADDETWEYIEGVCVYVFRDTQKNQYAAYYDMD